MNEQNTPTTVIIRHLSGSRTGQTEKFPAADKPEIRVGRGGGNDISFDPLKEDTISREHCRILRDAYQADEYTIVDSQSKNGTYVNDRMITEKTRIIAGDVIRLGKEGPSFEFDLDPRPVSHVKSTRVLDTGAANGKETKVHSTATGSTPKPSAVQATPVKEGVGKQTMAHMIAQSEKKNKTGLMVTILAVALLLGTGGFLLYKHQKDTPATTIIKEVSKPSNTQNAAQISKANEDKVVFIEMGWKLISTQTGEELYQVYLPMKSGSSVSYRAAYVTNNQGRTEPYIVTKSQAPSGAIVKPIGGFGTGSGFVVSEQGFVITNRHVAAPWLTTYHFSEDAFPGVLLTSDGKGGLKVSPSAVVSAGDVAGWIPAEAMNVNRQLLQSGVKLIDGASAYLDVTFANNSLRTPAKIVRVSSTHDVSMIKVDLPEQLSKVTMYDNYKDIAPGNAVTVMGYPAVSPDQFVANKSQDYFNRNPNIVKVPVPTVSLGNIGRMVHGSENNTKADEYMSTMGDYYQLTINSTGPGNSGGPMFDDQGRVIGIYSAGNSTISFAVPIKYAMELMGRTDVIH